MECALLSVETRERTITANVTLANNAVSAGALVAKRVIANAKSGLKCFADSAKVGCKANSRPEKRVSGDEAAA